MPTIHKNIEHKLARLKNGELIFTNDFRLQGSEAATKMALSRLTREGKISRLAHGIYIKPKTHPLFGIIYPSPDTVAEAIAKKEKIKIKPAGAYALNQLGLSTQVPMNFVYITNGSSRRIKIGKAIIKFKAVNPKRLAREGTISSLVIQALEELDIKKIDAFSSERIKELLLKEDQKKLQHDLKITTARISDFIVQLLKTPTDDRMDTIKL